MATMKGVARLRTLLALYLCSSFLAMPASGQSLQRFFSTPEQRYILDRLRAEGNVSDGTAENISIPAVQHENQIEQSQHTVYVPELETNLVALGGSVLSSDGSYTVWINGQPYGQHSLPRHMQLIEPFQQGQLKIFSANQNLVFQLKPGQTLDLDSGKVVESFNSKLIENPSANLHLDDARKPANAASVSTEIGQTADGEQDDKAS